jgi:hypothetical protein
MVLVESLEGELVLASEAQHLLSRKIINMCRSFFALVSFI